MPPITGPIGLLPAARGCAPPNDLFSRNCFPPNGIEIPEWPRAGAHALTRATGLWLIVHAKGWRWLLED